MLTQDQQGGTAPPSPASTAEDPIRTALDGAGSAASDLSQLGRELLPGVGALAGAAGALAIWFVGFGLLRRAAGRTPFQIDEILVRRLRRPSMFFLPLLAVQMIAPSLDLSEEPRDLLRHVLSIGLIATFAWLLLGVVGSGERIVLGRHDVGQKDNLKARRVHTQTRVIVRTLEIFIVVVAVAAILMTFPRIRQLGTSLLASAGIAGLVIALAARPTLENIFSGLQLAFTEPIRLDDVVIIAGEWGRVEEITATYVVVKVWDERRLIVPFSKFLQEPFQNWTRTTADILGTVMIYCDWSVPVEEVRAELKRIVEGHEKWDGRVCGLQVTETSERTIGLRALVSAADASAAWDLRCDVREQLVGWLQREHAGALPHLRANLLRQAPAGAG